MPEVAAQRVHTVMQHHLETAWQLPMGLLKDPRKRNNIVGDGLCQDTATTEAPRSQ